MLRLLPLFALALSLCAQQSVKYEFRFPNAAHHEADVRATFTGVSDTVLHLQMSRSSPGRYALHEFAKNVYDVHVTDGSGKPVQVSRTDPYSWDISGHDGTVIFEYTVFGDRADGTYAAIDLTHAHLNMPAALVWARGVENVPSSLKFQIPEGLNWSVATQLIPHSDGTWSAPNLEWLMDSPAELSIHDTSTWKVENETFHLTLHHAGTPQQTAVFARMCEAVVLEAEGVFGSLPKYDNDAYTFLVDYLPYASFDGMEHRDSTVITGSGNLKNDSDREIGAVSHEFFHSWNVKRIRPKSLEPFDFERTNMSGELWFAEGFTNYYGPLILKRTGLASFEDFVLDMSRAVNTVLTAPGRDLHDVIGMSDLAPFVDAAKSIDPTNFADTFISYYTYGQALALGIDLTIREQFPGKSLDDWMRTMWHEHPDVGRPYTLYDLENALAENTNPQFAEKLFRDHIYGKAPLDYKELLGKAGLLLRPARPNGIWLGAQVSYATNELEISSDVLRDSPLYNAGLDKGDKIYLFDGQAIKNETEMEAWLSKRHPGDLVQLEVETRAGKKSLGMVLAADPTLEIVSFEKAAQPVTPEITAFRASWLGSKAFHPLPSIEPMP